MTLINTFVDKEGAALEVIVTFVHISKLQIGHLDIKSQQGMDLHILDIIVCLYLHILTLYSGIQLCNDNMCVYGICFEP